MNRNLIISQRFGQQSVHYHETALLQKEIAQKLAACLPKMEQVSILEIGCGTGFLTEHLIKHYPDCHLHISDLSSKMLSFTAKNSLHHENISFEILDGENLPTRYHDKFELIVTSMTIQWFANPLNSIENILSCLKPNGILLYATLGADNFPEWRHSLKQLSLSSGLLKCSTLPGIFISEKIEISHHSALSFLKNLKLQGAQTARDGYKPLETSQLRKALQHMDEHYSSHTWHIIYGSLPTRRKSLTPMQS